MHGYGVACFTAKCRRRTTAPRRSPFTYSTYPLQTLPPSPFRSLFRRSSLSHPPVLLSSSSRSFATLVAASSRRYHFVCLSRGGPSRRALPYSRVHSSRPHAWHISIVYSSSLAYRSLPAMHTALHLPPIGALFSGLARDDRIRRITTCVFSTSRGEPPLASANARADFGLALIALGVKCGMRGFSSSKRHYLSPVCFVSLAVTGDKRSPPPPLPPSRIFRALISRYG